ncbi:hypothetical protein BaRGS_00006826 [Batillaria attramentaria]|uniref:DNA excision repair protein ERCC-1 n=1 Tax=Batillaria attramentaria TaxID=370345 RepID=A0ABD0LSV0_9CAEN
MAGKARFRIPTLEEMAKADEQETTTTKQLQLKSRMGQGPAGHQAQTGSAESSVAPHPQSPKKRMLSQKAMMSRQPLSMRAGGTKPKVPQPEGKSSNNKTKGPTGSLVEYNTRIERSGGVSLVRGQPETQQPASTSNERVQQSSEEQDAIRADTLPTLAKLGKTNSLVVNPRQRGNPVLKFVRSIPWEFGNIAPDYVMGQCNCALFLSLRYHQLNPEYIHMRLKQLGRSFELRVLLVQVDIKDPHHLLKELAKICILADCTLMLAFSAEEAGRYLETYKVYENKAVEAIMERSDPNFSVQLNDCLSRVKSVNKTDCATLLATFGSLQGIMSASVEDLSLCPGFGPQKAKRLHDVFREPFLVAKKRRANAVD